MGTVFTSARAILLVYDQVGDRSQCFRDLISAYGLRYQDMNVTGHPGTGHRQNSLTIFLNTSTAKVKILPLHSHHGIDQGGYSNANPQERDT